MSRGKIVVKHILVIMIVYLRSRQYLYFIYLKGKKRGHQKNILIFNSVFEIFQFTFKIIRNYYCTTTQIIIETHEFKFALQGTISNP